MTRDTELSGLVDALLEFTAPFTQILDHMARAPQSDANVAVETLRQMLPEVLAARENRFPQRDLRAATAVLNGTTDAVLSEILLVPHETDLLNASG